MSTTEFDPVTFVNITVPQKHERQYGVHSTGHNEGKMMFCRVNAEDKAIVNKWAALLSITPSEFIRGSAVNMAKALERIANERASTSREPHRSG